MGDELTAIEITALADAVPVGPKARTLLRMADFPPAAIPSMLGVNSADFWTMIAEEVAAGTVPDGRGRLLTAAARRYPHNPAFRHHATPRTPHTPGTRTTPGTPDRPSASDGPGASDRPGTPRVALSGPRGVTPAATPDTVPDKLRVLAVGAAPGGLPRIRADREARAILEAAELGHLTVELCPAAQAADLVRVRTFRPHILHLSCHGDGENLVFEDVHGEEHRVPAEIVAGALRHYRDTEGRTLRGLILGSCHGDRLARTFTGVAGQVIAHRAELDDTCAVVFTQQLYRHLRPGDDLGEAARDAAQAATLFDQTCASVSTSLLVLPDHP